MADPGLTEAGRVTRAAITIKQAFLDFREATWHTFVSGILNEGKDKPIVVLKDSSKAGRYNGWFSHFPNHLVHDEYKKNAVLTMMSFHEIGHMTRLIEQLHEGLDVLIEEVCVRLKPDVDRRTVAITENSHVDFNDYDYWLMRLTSRSTGAQWSLDFCGPQYGIHTPGIPWDILSSRFEAILAVRPFGTLAKYTAGLIELGGSVGMELEVGAQATQAFHNVVDPGMEKKGLTWAKILAKEEKDFQRHRDKVLRVGKKAIETYVVAENVTKKRQKAERYESRHEEELDIERRRLRERLGY